MAIKGKSRSRSRKAVTPGPRPTYVPVRKPWYARRQVQVAVLVVVLVAAGAGIWYGMAHSRTETRQREQDRLMRVAAVAYQGQVNQALAGVGQPLPPTGFSVLPTLKTDIDGLKKGTVTPRAALRDAKGSLAAARTAADAAAKIDASALVSGKGITDAAFVLNVVNSQARISGALKLYENVASLLQDAARATGDQRSELLTRASSILDVAGKLFADGYNDFVNLQGSAGILQPTLPSGTSPIGGSPVGGGS